MVAFLFCYITYTVSTIFQSFSSRTFCYKKSVPFAPQSTPLMKLMASNIGEVPFTMQGLANVRCLEFCCWVRRWAQNPDAWCMVYANLSSVEFKVIPVGCLGQTPRGILDFPRRYPSWSNSTESPTTSNPLSPCNLELPELRESSGSYIIIYLNWVCLEGRLCPALPSKWRGLAATKVAWAFTELQSQDSMLRSRHDTERDRKV